MNTIINTVPLKFLILGLFVLGHPLNTSASDTSPTRAHTSSKEDASKQVLQTPTSSLSNINRHNEGPTLSELAELDKRNLFKIAAFSTLFLFLMESTALHQAIKPLAGYTDYPDDNQTTLDPTLLRESSVALASYLTPALYSFAGNFLIAKNIPGYDSSLEENVKEVDRKFTERQFGQCFKMIAALSALSVASITSSPLNNAYLAFNVAWFAATVLELIFIEGVIVGHARGKWKKATNLFKAQGPQGISYRQVLPIAEFILANSFYWTCLALSLNQNQSKDPVNISIFQSIPSIFLATGVFLNWHTYRKFASLISDCSLKQTGSSILLVNRLSTVASNTASVIWLNLLAIPERSVEDNILAYGAIALNIATWLHAYFQSLPWHIRGHLNPPSRTNSFIEQLPFRLSSKNGAELDRE